MADPPPLPPFTVPMRCSHSFFRRLLPLHRPPPPPPAPHCFPTDRCTFHADHRDMDVGAQLKRLCWACAWQANTRTADNHTSSRPPSPFALDNPLDQSDHSGTKRNLQSGNLIGSFLVHKLLGPRPPPPPFSLLRLAWCMVVVVVVLEVGWRWQSLWLWSSWCRLVGVPVVCAVAGTFAVVVL